jgi:multimeric flavodoxin WrbA
MSQPIVLITFYSRCGTTETQALAAAVGAVQGRALIRLRRLPDVNAARTIEEFPECNETLVRMHKEYVPPAEADVLRADALIFASPPGSTTSSLEWTGYLDLLARLASQGQLAGKVGAMVHSENTSTVRSFTSRIMEMGMVPVPGTPADATALGRQVAAIAYELKQTTGKTT